MSRRTPKEITEFLKKFTPGHSAQETSLAVKKKFNYDMTPAQVKSYKANHKLKSGTTGYGVSDKPAEHIAYIYANYKGVGPTEMAQRLNSKFGAHYKTSQIKAFYANHNLHSGLTGRFEPGHVSYNAGKKGLKYPGSEVSYFKPGHTPHNKTAIGTVRRKSDGYLWQKTGEGSKDWKQLHRIVWEQHNGPVPPGGILTFLDGNPLNCDIKNLALIDSVINAQLNGFKLRHDIPELTQAGVTLLKLEKAIKERNR